MARPSYDQVFMEMAFVISKRSIDPSTKHGCVIVDKNKRVISIGYNGPVQGLEHDLLCWDRPQKYAWMIHAEENALIFAKRSLEDCTVYVTGPSCSRCFNHLVQAGVRRFVFGSVIARCVDAYSEEVVGKIAKAKGIEIRRMVD